MNTNLSSLDLYYLAKDICKSNYTKNTVNQLMC